MSKAGFNYYNTDTDRYQDTRIRKLKNRFGAAGIAIYDYILSEVYRVDGCYLKWRDDTAFGVADYFRIEEDTVITIVEYCVEIGLFHEPSFRSKSILTSESIQRRYVEMSIRAKRTNTSVPYEVLISNENAELREEMAKLREEMAKVPEETEKVPEVSRKVKYSKEEYKEEERKDYTSYSPKERINDSTPEIATPVSSEEKEPLQPTPEPPPLHPLQVFIRDKLPNVAKLKYQLTGEEAEKLLQEFDKVLIRDTLQTMDNWKPLLQKNLSVYLTLRTWIRKDKERNSNGTNIQTKQFNSASPPSNDGRIRTYNDRVNLNTGELLEISRAQRRQLAEQIAADKAANG